jgi:aminopeptidase N
MLGVEEAGPLPQYRLALSLDTANRRLAGEQLVTVPNRTGQDLSEIVFRLYPNLPQYGGLMGIGPVWVDGQRGVSSLRADGTSLVIPLDQPLPPEASVTISLTFDIEIPQRDSGHVLFGLSEDMWNLPDAYPLLAAHDGTTWREDIAPSHGDAVFAGTALYDVTLTVPPTLTVAATGSATSDTLTDGQHIYHIVGGPLREFAWVASADYLVAETTASGATVRSYYLPVDEAAGQAALNVAAAALRVYVDAFGPYPFPEMTVAEAPLLHFGMEYPSLNLIGVDLYRDQRSALEKRLAHEIAHQWWYAQVGSDQVNTPWLDEGLAEYSTAIYYREVFGQARANTLINQRWLVPYQAAVENGYDAIVNQPSAAFGNGKEYEVIVYAKAALFFEALRQELGDDTYKAVLHEYVDRYRWRIATPDDFLRVAESVSGQELYGLYSRWILSKQ